MRDKSKPRKAFRTTSWKGIDNPWHYDPTVSRGTNPKDIKKTQQHAIHTVNKAASPSRGNFSMAEIRRRSIQKNKKLSIIHKNTSKVFRIEQRKKNGNYVTP